MQTVLNPEYKTGIFKQELKNRFLCEVEIDGESTVCYVPSSCHLSNFLSLQGKKVILIPTMAKDARTQYAVYAVPYKRSYLILNTSMANRAIEASLRGRRFAYLGKRKNVIKEHYVDGYKSDLFIEDTNTIIEIKSVLSTDTYAKFPTVFSERSLLQLEKLERLMSAGYNVHYIIVSLNPYVKGINLLADTQFADALNKCIEHGMTISAFTCRLKDNKFQIEHMLQIVKK